MTVEHGEEAPFLEADQAEARERSENIVYTTLNPHSLYPPYFHFSTYANHKIYGLTKVKYAFLQFPLLILHPRKRCLRVSVLHFHSPALHRRQAVLEPISFTIFVVFFRFRLVKKGTHWDDLSVHMRMHKCFSNQQLDA